MTYVPTRKGTILIPSGPSHDLARNHLFVICTDPCEKGLQLIVPISSKTNDLCDPTCVLQPHEHDFFVRESFVFYRKSRIELTETLVSGVQKNVFSPHIDMNAQTFLRVYNGICNSSETSRKVKSFIGC